MTTPRGMTPKKLRKIADWLDTYDRVAERYIDLIEAAHGDTTANTQKAREAVQAKDLQADLRRWADEMETPTE